MSTSSSRCEVKVAITNESAKKNVDDENAMLKMILREIVVHNGKIIDPMLRDAFTSLVNMVKSGIQPDVDFINAANSLLRDNVLYATVDSNPFLLGNY